MAPSAPSRYYYQEACLGKVQVPTRGLELALLLWALLLLGPWSCSGIFFVFLLYLQTVVRGRQTIHYVMKWEGYEMLEDLTLEPLSNVFVPVPLDGPVIDHTDSNYKVFPFCQLDDVQLCFPS
jgi:hypothetical protein